MLGIALAALLVTATASPTPSSSLPTEDEVVAIPEELREQLHRQVIDRTITREQRLQRLVEFMFDPKELALEFDEQYTRTAEQAFLGHKANCLSFTLLFVTLAREAGLEAYVQETDQVLSWYEQNGTVYSSGHVNAGVRIGPKRQTIDIDRSILMTRGPPRPISDKRALSHYYNNRGAELMRDGDFAAARAHLHKGTQLTSDHFLALWNNLGVLEVREGHPQAAEQAYLTALKKDPRYAATLLNLLTFYQRTGNRVLAADFQSRLVQAQLNDPFHQFLLAEDSEKRGDYKAAITHYRRAIKLHDKEHRFYFGLARVYAQLGDIRHARRALTKARDVSSGDPRGMYQAKLDSLQRVIAGLK